MLLFCNVDFRGKDIYTSKYLKKPKRCLFGKSIYIRQLTHIFESYLYNLQDKYFQICIEGEILYFLGISVFDKSLSERNIITKEGFGLFRN